MPAGVSPAASSSGSMPSNTSAASSPQDLDSSSESEAVGDQDGNNALVNKAAEYEGEWAVLKKNFDESPEAPEVPVTVEATIWGRIQQLGEIIIGKFNITALEELHEEKDRQKVQIGLQFSENRKLLDDNTDLYTTYYSCLTELAAIDDKSESVQAYVNDCIKPAVDTFHEAVDLDMTTYNTAVDKVPVKLDVFITKHKKWASENNVTIWDNEAIRLAVEM